jgi:hypothetical protein
MTEKDFSNHVLYVSGQKNNAGNKTGARCVVDLLLAAGLVTEDNGKLTVSTPTVEASSEFDPTLSGDQQTPEAAMASALGSSIPTQSGAAAFPTFAGSLPQVAINIQLHLPETENAEVYEKLFRALRENLLNPVGQ